MATDSNEPEIRKALVDAGAWLVSTKAAGRRGGVVGLPAGFPDLLVLDPFCLIEVKAADGKLSAKQVDMWAKCALRGVPYFRVTTAEEAIQALDTARRMAKVRV
jgi:hypothetical protein